MPLKKKKKGWRNRVKGRQRVGTSNTAKRQAKRSGSRCDRSHNERDKEGIEMKRWKKIKKVEEITVLR
eukprot:g34192.t1